MTGKRQDIIRIDGETLSIDDVMRCARLHARVEVAEQARAGIEMSRRVVESIAKGDTVVYGIKTGFGELCTVSISSDDVLKLQRNLVRSHCVGVGSPLSEETARALLLVRANTLVKGHSGVRPVVIEQLLSFLNIGLYPAIPEKGSVGASGDLAPLAHMASALIGEGHVFLSGANDKRATRPRKLPAAQGLRRKGLVPLVLQAKEGLALVNGTSFMTAVGALTLYDAGRLMACAEIAAAMSLEALMGTDAAFDAEAMDARPHAGQNTTARNLRALLRDSALIGSHRDCLKVQDAYTLRCIPQVLGASRDALAFARHIIEIEMNSATDNPLIFDERSISCGNFHGQPVALAMDCSAIALATLGNFAERRIARLLDDKLSNLPPFLTKKSGLNSGLMGLQYTAAALVNENKVLASPASADSIPTCANQEDHVSMGAFAATKAARILRNTEHIVAIELLCAAQGLEFRKPLKPGVGVEASYRLIRRHVKALDEDRMLDADIQKVLGLIRAGEVLRAVEDEVGEL